MKPSEALKLQSDTLTQSKATIEQEDQWAGAVGVECAIARRQRARKRSATAGAVAGRGRSGAREADSEDGREVWSLYEVKGRSVCIARRGDGEQGRRAASQFADCEGVARGGAPAEFWILLRGRRW